MVIAMPTLASYNYYITKVQNLIIEMERVSLHMVAVLSVWSLKTGGVLRTVRPMKPLRSPLPGAAGGAGASRPGKPS